MKLILYQLFMVTFMFRLPFGSGCTEYAAYVVFETKAVYYTYSYSCGWWGWYSCTAGAYYTGYVSNYMAQLQCCSGYGGEECLPICNNPNCTTNMECTLPQNCTCITGWEGTDCLTDIDECSTGTHDCQEICVNNNGSYTCSCGNDTTLGSNGISCLGSVNNLTTSAETHNFRIFWFPPTNHSFDANTTLTGYNVKCNATEEDEFIPFPTTNHSLDSLSPFTVYQCCVEPEWTTNGILNEAGPTQCIEVLTLEDAPSDTPHNISMIAGDSESILIEWTPPLIPNGIITHYNIYINYTNGSDIDTRNTIDGSSTLYLLEHLDIFQLVGVSISATTIGGEGPQSLYTFNRSGETEPDPVHYLNVDIVSHDLVNISWHPPLLLKGVIISYHITLRNLTKYHSALIMDQWVLDSDDRHYIIHSLKPYIPYELDIAASTAIGKGDIIVETFFTLEAAPSIAPVWSLIDRDSISTIRLAWTSLTLEESRGFITNYTIIYAESISLTSCSLIGDENEITVDSENQQLELSELDSRSLYCVSIAGSTAEGIGTFSEWSLIDVFKKESFYLLIQNIRNCESWILSDSSEKLQDITDEIVSAVGSACECPVTAEHVYSSTFQECSTDGSVIVEISMFLTSDGSYDGERLLSIIRDWIGASKEIAIKGVYFPIVLVCGSIDECYPKETSTSIIVEETRPPSSSSLNAAGLASIIVSIIVILLLIIVAIGIFLGVYIKMKKNAPDSMPSKGDPHNDYTDAGLQQGTGEGAPYFSTVPEFQKGDIKRNNVLYDAAGNADDYVYEEMDTLKKKPVSV